MNELPESLLPGLLGTQEHKVFDMEGRFQLSKFPLTVSPVLLDLLAIHQVHLVDEDQDELARADLVVKVQHFFDLRDALGSCALG